MNPRVETLSQACAFIEALVGWEDFSEGHGRPFSPHALTAIRQYLGMSGVPSHGAVWHLMQGINCSSETLYLKNLAMLLQSVGDVILQNLKIEE